MSIQLETSMDFNHFWLGEFWFITPQNWLYSWKRKPKSDCRYCENWASVKEQKRRYHDTIVLSF
jgi:hypothetical protein